MEKLHLVGIGGVGMSALAETLLDHGACVSGSDRFLDQGRLLPVLSTLRNQGIDIVPQNGSGVHSGLTAVVTSSAIESDNPDILAANRLGIPIKHRSNTLAETLAGKYLVAITGTCGKSTITPMLGHILDVADLAPTVVNGAPCVNWHTPQRTGAVLHGMGPHCVVEVDESDRSLLNFHPKTALVSNASADHFSLEETNALFDAFIAQVSGNVIDGRHDSERLPEITEHTWSSTFEFRNQVITLPQPGRHNAINAWQAARMSELLGVQAETTAKALATFKGIKRRLETIGIRSDGVRVIDEYAHNTEKIRATLITLKNRSTRTLALWRPHGYGPLEKMLESLTEMFIDTLRPDDHLFLLPVFDAGGSASRTIKTEMLQERLAAAGVKAEWLPDHAAAIMRINTLATSGDIIVTMGARDPDLPETAKALSAF